MADAATYDWLKSDGKVAAFSNAAAAGFGAGVTDSAIRTPFDTAGGVNAEGARQLAFLDGPLVPEVLRVEGMRVDLIGRAVTLTAPVGGYAAGATVYVIGADEQDDGGTLLEVLRVLT